MSLCSMSPTAINVTSPLVTNHMLPGNTFLVQFDFNFSSTTVERRRHLLHHRFSPIEWNSMVGVIYIHIYMCVCAHFGQKAERVLPRYFRFKGFHIWGQNHVTPFFELSILSIHSLLYPPRCFSKSFQTAHYFDNRFEDPWWYPDGTPMLRYSRLSHGRSFKIARMKNYLEFEWIGAT